MKKDDKVIDVTNVHPDGTQTTRSLTMDEWMDEDSSRQGVTDAKFFDGYREIHRNVYSYGYDQDHLVDQSIENTLLNLRQKRGPQIRVVATYSLPYGKEEI